MRHGTGNIFSITNRRRKFLVRRPGITLLDVIARRLQKLAIVDAAGAGRFARATAKAKIDVAHARVCDRQSAILQGAHDVDPSARRIVFVAGLQDK